MVPASTSAGDIVAMEPDGVFLSNGPGDPAAVAGVPDDGGVAARRGARLRDLHGPPDARPRPSAAPPSSCPFGHHGGNHPVRDHLTGKVEITSQNHNYCVDDACTRPDRGHPPQPERRDPRGVPMPRRAGLRRSSTTPRRARSPRQPLPLRAVRRPHGRAHVSRCTARPSEPDRGSAEAGLGDRVGLLGEVVTDAVDDGVLDPTAHERDADLQLALDRPNRVVAVDVSVDRGRGPEQRGGLLGEEARPRPGGASRSQSCSSTQATSSGSMKRDGLARQVDARAGTAGGRPPGPACAVDAEDARAGWSWSGPASRIQNASSVYTRARRRPVRPTAARIRTSPR